MAFIIRNTSGIVCAPLAASDAKRLHLDPMVGANDAPLGTAFTVSVDCNTGSPPASRRRSAPTPCARSPTATAAPADFVRPGHVFPLVAREGGVLMRSGHTEACVDLCRLAGLPPVGVLAELMNDDGTVMRGPDVAAFAEKHKLSAVSIAELIALPAGARQAGRAASASSRSPRRSARCKRLRLCDAVRPRAPHGLRLWRCRRRPRRAGAAAPRRHRARRVRRRQGDPLRARALQAGRPRRHGATCATAPPACRSAQIPQDGRPASRPRRSRQWREIGLGAQILKDLGISSIRLLASHRKRTYVGLGGFGIEIVATETEN